MKNYLKISLNATATSFCDLGDIRSSDDTYTEHDSKMAQRRRQLIGQCFRVFHSRDPRFLVHVYRIYILPILNYGSPVWSPHQRQQVNELESVQRRFTRRLASLRGYSYGERLRNLSLLSLESASLYKIQDLISQLAILEGGGVSGFVNIVPLPSPRRLTLNSEKRRYGTRYLPICYNYRNCHSLSLLLGINC